MYFPYISQLIGSTIVDTNIHTYPKFLERQFLEKEKYKTYTMGFNGGY